MTWLVMHKLGWKQSETQRSLYFLCPSSSSSCPEPQILSLSREEGPFYHAEEEAEVEAEPGYYNTNSYQYQDTEL